jgi:hypothetical protein
MYIGSSHVFRLRHQPISPDQSSISKQQQPKGLTSMTRAIKVNLSDQASEDLKAVARDLGMTETEILRKGLLVMGLYAKLKKENRGALLLQDGETTRELLIG